MGWHDDRFRDVKEGEGWYVWTDGHHIPESSVMNAYEGLIEIMWDIVKCDLVNKRYNHKYSDAFESCYHTWISQVNLQVIPNRIGP